VAQHTKATRDVRRRVGTTESTIRGGHARDTWIASSLSASGADNMENSSRFKYDRQQDTRGTNLWLAGRSSDDMTQGVVTQVKIRTGSVLTGASLTARGAPHALALHDHDIELRNPFSVSHGFDDVDGWTFASEGNEET